MELALLAFFSVFQLFFQFRYLAVLQLGHARQVLSPHGGFQFGPCAFEFFLDVGRALYRRFFRFPDFIEIGEFTFHFSDFLLQLFQAFDRGIVCFLLQGLTLNFLLDQLPFQAIQGLRFGVDFHANSRCGFVHQVDGFVR